MSAVPLHKYTVTAPVLWNCLDKFTSGLHTAESSGQFSALILTSQQPQTQLVPPSPLKPRSVDTTLTWFSSLSLWLLLGLHSGSYSSPGLSPAHSVPWTLPPLSHRDLIQAHGLGVCLQGEHFQTASSGLTPLVLQT